MSFRPRAKARPRRWEPAGAKKPRTRPRQLEWQEQCRLVEWLDLGGVKFCAVPNGGYALSPQAGKRLKLAGLRKGFPDLLIFDAPPNAPEFVGVAIEMKEPNGDAPTEDQQDWLIALAARGWKTAVCYGAVEALKLLSSLGYRVPG